MIFFPFFTGLQVILMFVFKAGIWYIMWSNIGNVAEHKESLEFLPSPRRSIDSGTGKPLNDAMYVYADCHSSIRGTFLGNNLIFPQQFLGLFQPKITLVRYGRLDTWIIST